MIWLALLLGLAVGAGAVGAAWRASLKPTKTYGVCRKCFQRKHQDSLLDGIFDDK